MRRRRLVTLVASIALVLWVAVVAFVLLGAARDLERGRDVASAVADDLDESSLLDGTTVDALDEAAEHFRAAHRGLRHPLVAPVRFVPWVGRQLRSIDASSAAAQTVADVAADTLRRSSELSSQGVTAGRDRLQLLDGLVDAIATARRRLDGVRLGSGRALVAPVAEAHVELGLHLADARRVLRRADRALVAVRSLLAGPSRYLLVAANNAEMRGGSGMWLTGGLLHTEGGRIELGEIESLYDVADPPEHAVAIGDVGLRSHWAWMQPQREWRSLMASPRLPASASLAQRMWAAAGQPPINGVLVVDAVGLSHLVAATGGVTVDGRSYDRDSIVHELLHDQYVRFQGERGRDERRDALNDTADAVFDALDEGRWQPPELLKALALAVRGRHLMAWSSDPTEQRGWAAAAMSGQLRHDSLALSILNRGGNKLDWFTAVEADLRSRPEGNDTIVTATVTVTNRVPDGEPEYVAGPVPGAGTVVGEYKGVLTLNLPAAATQVQMSGAQPTIAGTDGPTSMIATDVRLLPGATTSVTVHFRMPGPHGRLVIEPSARMPAVRWTAGSSSWRDDRPRSHAW